MGIVQKVEKEFSSYKTRFPSVRQIFERVQAEPQGGNLGGRNWRLKEFSEIGKRNGGEVGLERAIIKAHQGAGAWFNQVPTCSGLFEVAADTRSSVDLARDTGSSRYEMIELKLSSDDFKYAALELLTYAGVYCLCRRELKEKLGPQSEPIMAAKTIELQVLAPADYYAKADEARALAATIDGELKAYFAEVPLAGLFPMSFDFFKLHETMENLAALGEKYAGNKFTEADFETVRRLVASRSRV